MPPNAGAHEPWEESGIHVELTRAAGTLGGEHCGGTYRNGDRPAWVATVFHARPTVDALRADGGETRDSRFFSRDEVAALTLKTGTRMFTDGAAAAGSEAFFKPPSCPRPEAGATSARYPRPRD